VYFKGGSADRQLIPDSAVGADGKRTWWNCSDGHFLFLQPIRPKYNYDNLWSHNYNYK